MNLKDLFAQDGALARVLPAYLEREEQIICAKGVNAAIQDGTIYLAEVPTGIGKSFAYLGPALLWLAEDPDRRIVISTATIILQRQLMDKDIPAMLAAIGKDIPVCLLQGRSNYLCLNRLEEAAYNYELTEGAQIERIKRWAETTQTGTRDSMPFMPSQELWDAISSEKLSCAARACDEETCFYARARARAMEAQLLIVNHALLLSDLAVRLEYVLDLDEQVLLPPYQVVICDEAHVLERSAESACSETVSPYLFEDLERQLAGGIRNLAKAGITVGSEIPKSMRALAQLYGEFTTLLLDTMGKMDMPHAMDIAVCEAQTQEQLSIYAETIAERLKEAYQQGRDIIRKQATDAEGEVDPAASYFALALQEVVSVSSFFERFITRHEDREWVYWCRTMRLSGAWGQPSGLATMRTPLEVGPFLRAALFEKAQSVICMSATLQGGKTFAYWRSRVGLGQAFDAIVDEYAAQSPFAIDERMLIAVPQDAPAPTFVSAHTSYMIDLVEAAVAKNPTGGSLVLFTSYKQMHEVASALSDRMGAKLAAGFDEDGNPLQPRRILVQGRGHTRAALLREFKESTGTILLATSSFWEGVDAPGRALNLLIIAKLPFDQLGDPVLEARSQRLKEQGLSPFGVLSLPRTALRLKQGVGRLMRRETDGGVVIIADSRMLHKSYGRYLFDTLPPAQISTKPLGELIYDIDYYLEIAE